MEMEMFRTRGGVASALLVKLATESWGSYLIEAALP